MITSNKRVKTPTVLQMEAMECGAASLAIILAHYRLFLPLEQVRLECGVTRDGSKAVNILKAGIRLGLKSEAYRYSPETLKTRQLPVIIHWNFNHFLVLEGFKGDKVYLNDPASGHRTVTWDEFETSYTGITLVFTPGPGFQPGGSPPSVAAAVARRLGGNKSSLVFVLLVGLGLIFPNLAVPVFSQVFFDDILTHNHLEWVNNLLFAMGFTAVLLAALTWLRAWSLTRWQGSLTIGDSSRFFWHVLKMPMEFFQQRYGGEVASRVQFNEAVAAVLTGQAATAVLDVAVTVFFLALLVQYNVTLTIIGSIFSLINAGILYFMFRWMVEQQMQIQQDAGKAHGTAMAGIFCIETLKAGGNEGDFFTKWASYQSNMLAGQQKIELSRQALMLAPVLLAGINAAVIMAVGGFQIMDGLMTVGIFVAFQNLMTKFQEPLNNILQLSQSLQTTQMQMQRLDDVLHYPVDQANYPDRQPPGIGRDKLSGRVEMRNVSFGYSRLDAPLIENFSLVIKPGHRVALIGGSGSGKSTVAKLVTGLYQPWSGEVLFDGIPRPEIPREVISNSVAVVDQDIFLFDGAVADNIALFDSTIDRRDIVQAAKDAAIHNDITVLPNGYEYLVEEGGRNFSGGQRQRLEIARALAVNPSVLVLDEATSALDTLTEQAVTNNIRRRGCACLLVAHRLSTIRDCDEIIVLEKGKVIQRGTHEQMMAEDGPYRMLVGQDTPAPSQGGQ